MIEGQGQVVNGQAPTHLFVSEYLANKISVHVNSQGREISMLNRERLNALCPEITIRYLRNYITNYRVMQMTYVTLT